MVEDQAGQATDPDLRVLVEKTNIAEDMDKEELEKLGAEVSEGFEADLRSREDWEKNLDEWTKLALQVKERKMSPWPDASNVKYPLLSTASMQFNARAYPSLIPSTGDLVKCEVIGKDPDGMKLEQAQRVGNFMSYQLLHEMDGWEEDMDKLLMMLPIVGILFKKTYYNSERKHIVSELVMPKDLVVNAWATNLADAERVSQVIRLNKRQVKERQNAGTYLKDVELGDPIVDDQEIKEVRQDSTVPYQIIEQHTYYDYDGDGLPEPYVITFERRSKKILRITARFTAEGISLDEDGEVALIEPLQYFTKFGFIPNPEGCFYDIGFGLLLTPLNESVNTLINQLIDSGTLNNLQGGVLGRGLKFKMGDNTWKPGEWKTLNSNVDDIKKQMLPLPTKEPSKVLFELMGTLITSGKELASVAEIFVGKMPGQNTPATTTMATIEQGMKVFTAVYKRLHRSLSKEYKKIYKLNAIYLDPSKYEAVLDTAVMPDDFLDESYNVCPTADPSSPTQSEKLMKAQALLELVALGTLDPVEVTRRVLEAQEQPAMERLFNQEIQATGQFSPPPDPKVMAMQAKSQMEQQKTAMDMQAAQMKMELDARDKVIQILMKQQEHAMDMKFKQQEAMVDGAIAVQKQKIFSATEQAKGQQQVQQQEVSHQQQMRHGEEKQQLAQKQQKQKNSSATGKGIPSRGSSRKPSK